MNPFTLYSARFATLLVLWINLLPVNQGWCAEPPSNASAAQTAQTAQTNAAGQSIGIEGRAVVTLPASDYQPKPLDDRTELILRIEKTEPAGADGTRYHFHFIGLESGGYLLADYLVRPDGSRPDEIGEVRLRVEAILPDEHDGQLNAYVSGRFPFIGGYRALMATLGGVWLLGFVGFAIAGRKKRRAPTPLAIEPVPSFAERLRPLVEEAATGRLTIEGQATLERLLMGYWRDRLALPDVRMSEALAQLKAHSEAGAILRAMERWLHQPGGASPSEIRTLLEPYRAVAIAQSTDEGRAA